MNFSMWLTLLRIAFVPVLVVLLLVNRRPMDLWAAGLFGVAGISDFLDGYLARKRAQVTSAGVLLDPIADKLLTSAAFICLVQLRLVPAWMAVVIIGREFAISGLRGVASTEGFLLAPSSLGKTKMFLQVLAIVTLILGPRWPVLRPWAMALLWLVIVFAVGSAVQYGWNYSKKLRARAQQQASGNVVILRAGEKEREKGDVAAQ
jgi:CDP-diacylglycerol--glycerol-3-phosphate 3-phosphatidyltransferase